MEQQRRPPGPQNASSSQQQQQQQPRGQQPPAAQRKQPEPPAGAHLYVNKPWSPKAVLTERSLSRPPSVVFTKKTLERLFGWTHGACKDICPTVVFRCTPPGGGAPTELEPVQLLPPSRDDRDVEHKKREGGMRGRVDGYPVPGPAVKKLLVQLFGGTSPAGHRLHFRSAGWRGTQLVVDASHEAAGAGEGPGEASDGEGQEGETSQPGPQRSAGGAAHSQAQAMPAPTAAAAAAAAASPADERQQEGWTGAAASTGNRAVPAANAAASSGRQPAPASQDVIVIDDESPPIRSPQATIPLEVPVKQAAPSHSFSGLGGLVAAAEQASAGGASAGGPPAGAGAALPLMASLDSLQPAAQRIVQEAHSGWLSTDQVHKLMASHKALGVPLAEQQPFRPQAGDLFLADRQLRFDKKDGHSWVDRRSNKLKVDGKDVLQVVYFTTRDGTLQRRAYHFLPGCEPQGGQVHPHLLHYQLPEALLNSEKGKPGPKKRVSDAQQADRQARRQAAAQVPLPPSPPMHQAQRQGSQGAEPAALGFNPTPLDLARWSREEKIWAECGDIVRNLLDQATLEVFGQPVDPVKVPEYYQAVKQPMDLGTILSKLSATPRGYSSPLEFRDDVRLTFANCRLFNPEGTSVRKLGDAASARFEAEWKAALVEARWEANRLPTEQARQAQQQAQQLLQQQPQQAPTTRQQQHQQQSPPPLLPQQAQQAQQQQPQQAPTTRQQQHQQQSPPPPLPQPPQQPQQPAGRPTQPAVPCSAQAAGAAAAEAAAAAAAAQAEAEAAATLSPQARLAQQRAGRAERMYSGGYSMPDLDGEGEEEEVEEEQQQRRPRSPSAGWHAWMHAGAPAGWREQQLAASSAAQPQRQLAVLSAGRPQRQAAKVARKRTAADLAADAAALAEQLGSSSEEEEDLDIVRRSTARPATQQAQQAKVALKAERLAAEQRRQELATAAEERQRNAAAEAERRAAEQRQRQQQEALERRAAQQRQQEAAAAEAEHHRQQQDAAAAEAEQQRQQQEAAVAEAERQRQAAEEERRAQQAQYAQQQQQQQQQAQQEEKQPGQKREREGAAAGTSETLPDAKRQATMAQPPAVHPEKQPEIQVEQQPGASPHAGSGSMAPPAAKLADRNAAVGDAIIILRRAQVPGPRMTEFVTKFIQGNNNASDVAGIMDLLRAVDAACNAQAVCALVDTYMAQ